MGFKKKDKFKPIKNTNDSESENYPSKDYPNKTENCNCHPQKCKVLTSHKYQPYETQQLHPDGSNTNQPHPKDRCRCNQDHAPFNYQDLPPPSPPDGRTDLWELQFCRWWGWNWVKKKQIECTNENSGTMVRDSPVKRRSLEKPGSQIQTESYVKKTSRITYSEPNETTPPPMTKQPSPQQQIQISSRPLPNKKQFKELCKCIFRGSSSKSPPCTMHNLYNTPSNSVVMLESYSYGVSNRTVDKIPCWPKCPMQKSPKVKKNKAKVKKNKKDRKAHSNVESEEEQVADYQYIEIDEVKKKPSSYSSTEESIEYLSVRLHNNKSGMPCSCQTHLAPQKQERAIERTEMIKQPVAIKTEDINVQTSIQSIKESKETQTIQTVDSDKTNICSCEPNMGYQQTEQVFKLKGKKHKTICLYVCCCGGCEGGKLKVSPNFENDSSNVPIKNDVSTKLNNGCKADCIKNKKISDANTESSKYLDDNSNVRKESNKSQEGAGGESVKSENDILKRTQSAFPVVMPPYNSKKIFSKYGTPSKKYAWLHNINSDATTITLSETYKSPVSGKTYDLKPMRLDEEENIPLPELIDISEDLTYLKKVENIVNSDTESRLFLDAVCDAILSDHSGIKEESTKVLEEFMTDQEVTSALNRDYRDLGILCNIKSSRNNQISVPGIPENKTSKQSHFASDAEDQRPKVDDIEAIVKRIIEKDYKDHFLKVKVQDSSKLGGKISYTEKNESGQPSTLTLKENFKSDGSINEAAAKNNKIFKFNGAESPVFTKTGLLSSKSSGIYRKSKRENLSCSVDNDSKKVKQEFARDTSSLEKCCERKENQIGNIFAKIEDIVKRSTLKSAEIQQVLTSIPEKKYHNDVNNETTSQIDESSKYSFLENDTKDFSNESLRKVDISRRSYPMASDIFKEGWRSKVTDIGSTKMSYEIFSDNFSISKTDFKYCAGSDSDAITEENFESNEHIESKTNTGSYKVKKAGKLSIQNFIVCDEKSSMDQKPTITKPRAEPKRSLECSKTEKKSVDGERKVGAKAEVHKKPIQKKSSDGSNGDVKNQAGGSKVTKTVVKKKKLSSPATLIPVRKSSSGFATRTKKNVIGLIK